MNIGGPRQRAVLAAMLLRANESVSLEHLIDAVWEKPPARPCSNIRTYVTGIRKKLSEHGDAFERLRTLERGYLLEVRPGELDLTCFDESAARAERALRDGDLLTAARSYQQALKLWRGHPLQGLQAGHLLRSEQLHLEERRLTAETRLARAKIDLGEHEEVTIELRRLLTRHPLREELWANLMLALYRCGRQGEALAAFSDVRNRLVEELGIEPGPAVQRLHEQILVNAPELIGKRHHPQGPRMVPAQLPADVVGFIGREAELAQLDEWRKRNRSPAMSICVVSGTAGVGKSALVTHWAHRILGEFPDGQIYVNLRGFDPGRPLTADDGLTRFLIALGVPDTNIPVSTDERSALYRTLVAQRRMLVVLDNASSVEQVRPLLPGAGSCAVLVTSRDSLAGLIARDGAQRIDLDVLPVSDARTLLRDLIGPRADREPDAISMLVEQCAQLPLALRVAAERTVSRPAAPLADLVEELTDEQRRLDVLDAGGDQHTAVRTVFSWSVLHLPPDVARTFRLLGLHPGPDIDPFATAALAVTGLDQSRTMLEQLARNHLIRPTSPGRYGMHDLLRAYAIQVTTAVDSKADRKDALSRLFDHYLAAAATAMDRLHPAEAHLRPAVSSSATLTPDLSSPDAARQWLDGHLPSLTAMAAHTATHGWPVHAVLLSAVLYRYLYGGHNTEGLTIHAHAHHAARQCGDQAAEAQALLGLGTSYRQLGQYGRAGQHLEHAQIAYRRAGDHAGEAHALINLAAVSWRLSRYGHPADHYRQALLLFRRTGDVLGEARAVNNLGLVESRLGRFDVAADYNEHALHLYRRLGHSIGEAHALTNLALIEQGQGRFSASMSHLQAALTLYRRLGDQSGEACALDALGVAETALGRPDLAATLHCSALARFQEIGETDGEAAALNGLGKAAFAANRNADALTHHHAALAKADSVSARDQQARAHAGLGHVHLAAGERTRARRHFEAALALYTELESAEVGAVQAVVDDLSHLARRHSRIQK